METASYATSNATPSTHGGPGAPAGPPLSHFVRGLEPGRPVTGAIELAPRGVRSKHGHPPANAVTRGQLPGARAGASGAGPGPTSPVMTEVFSLLGRLASTDVTVTLIDSSLDPCAIATMLRQISFQVRA